MEEAEKKLKDYESMDIDKIKEDAVKEALAEKEKEIEIDNYRRELIQNNPNAIPELIVGETKEQLDASVETAIKAFSNACARANINVGASAMSNIPSATPTGTGANIPGGSAGSQYTFKDLVGLDPRSEEYKKVRQALNLV